MSSSSDNARVAYAVNDIHRALILGGILILCAMLLIVFGCSSEVSPEKTAESPDKIISTQKDIVQDLQQGPLPARTDLVKPADK